MREIMLPSQTLPDFQQYLLSRKLAPGKSVTFYAYWANRYLTFSKRLKNANAIPQIEVSSLRYRLVSRRCHNISTLYPLARFLTNWILQTLPGALRTSFGMN